MTAPRRSDATRAAILTAARERFAADGYERATIRVIAGQAGIDPAMVMRYYGSKERLFAAAAEFSLDMPDVSAVPPEEAARALVAHFLDRWERDDTLMALLRVAVTNEAGADRMRAIVAEQVAPLVASITPDPAEARVRAGLIATQILGLALCRHVLRIPPVSELTRAEILAWVSPAIQRYLTEGRPGGGGLAAAEEIGHG